MAKRRVIDELRELVPGGWAYDFLLRVWRHESGREVYASAQLAPRFDGDDDSFVTVYRWSDSGERVPVGFAPLGRL